MASGDEWTPEEVTLLVADYLDMLGAELQGRPFNKAAHNRALQRVIPRSAGSIERKHMNVSAVLRDFGHPYIDGYKPYSNYQRSLLPGAVAAALAARPEIGALIERIVHMPAASDPQKRLVEVPVPKASPVRESLSSRVEEDSASFATPRNYAQLEAQHRSLGLSGEELVLEFEHRRLRGAGQKKLAERIEHVSKAGQDHVGYDILSFEPNGKERLIEVKTTRFAALTPFFASRNEVSVSAEHADRYHVYRVFKFDASPRFFVLPGAISSTCELEAAQYSAIPRPAA